LRSVCWADIPQLSAQDRRCPAAWQQYWQQLRRRCLHPRPSAFQGLLVIPTDLERRIAEPIPADRQVARRMQLSGSDRDNPRPTTSSGTRGARPAPFRSAASWATRMIGMPTTWV